MTTLVLNDAKRYALAEWAEARPEIIRLWVIGSRATGRAREDSDLDLTVELQLGPGDSNELVALIASRNEWAAQLTSLMGLIVKDIQLENDPDDPCFGLGRKSGVLVFDRG
ncbi:putative nucleotidyltransferase [Bradyrhizobium sp. AZCC 1678]|uniref:nucleotidyltransferase family protein n=1 Tax=Bradyrhizobium sp. AZCC 1678 TaxID=3117030 RepID=UPI002FF03788